LVEKNLASYGPARQVIEAPFVLVAGSGATGGMGSGRKDGEVAQVPTVAAEGAEGRVNGDEEGGRDRMCARRLGRAELVSAAGMPRG